MGTATRAVPSEDVAGARRRLTRLTREALLGYGLITPVVLYLLVLIAYPFLLSIYFSLSNVTVAGGDGGFAGLRHYQELLGDEVFQKAVIWTLLFEVLGLGCGFGPLTLRFVPPIGGFLYWLRPGTVRLPPWPRKSKLSTASPLPCKARARSCQPLSLTCGPRSCSSNTALLFLPSGPG